jgi:hypothetical protein
VFEALEHDLDRICHGEAFAGEFGCEEAVVFGEPVGA